MNSNDLVNFFRRAMQPLKDRVFLMVGRCIIKAIDDGKVIQELQIAALKDETMDRIPRFQEFGFGSNPPVGTEAIMVALGGNRENTVVIATDHRNFRKKDLAPGETAIYNEDFAATYIHLKRNGEILIKTATKVTVETALTHFTGNVTIAGTLAVTGATSLLNTLAVTGATTLSSTLAVTGTSTLTGAVTAPGGVSSAGAIVGATVTAAGISIASIQSVFNSHTHPENGSGGGTTSAPNQSI
jgi:phage baseplate assembly protein V